MIVIRIREACLQCARALMRAGLRGDAQEPAGLPAVGEMLNEITSGDFDGKAHDEEWPARARKSL